MSTTLNTAATEHLIDVGILPDSSASAPDPAAQIAAQAAEIADLKARLDAQMQKGNNRPIELEHGESLSVKAAQARLDAMSVDTQLEILKSQRFIAQLADEAASRTPIAAQKPLLSKEDAENLLGRTGWESLNNAEKAKVLDIRQSDLDKLDPKDYFGRNSSSRAAHELSQSNRGLYRLLKARAQKLGLI